MSMASGQFLYTVAFLCLMTLPSTQPITVTFGTKEGPIEPRQPKSPQSQEKPVEYRNPAPVSEERIDIPNPNTYRPPFPHQYREKIYSYKAPSNLILGTPLDQKYTPSISKYHYYKKQLQKLDSGVDYTGPHIFEKQEYEFYPKTILSPSVKYNKPVYVPLTDKNGKYVPEIGIIYSSGVRYYIPQVVIVNSKEVNDPKDENSVYDVEDAKYYQ
ncbi:uncharacterized protein LOC130900144 [Diorhabda carinulata]|uniref:uncharacterized protein LOC130900144 n=1 Tax=Diorhabda carinulata TaxID=1163345 RepID=UPI0025A102C5|nr:uncharacterized protein LOC130900144 [Diorhabda carinulata]